ncbi:hypothetical protein, partial [Brucella oryzae]|uniref:hypothetical protein n=1 Tax=Brucella oryzae TaxID=335286 RepID=UPI0035BC6737
SSGKQTRTTSSQLETVGSKRWSQTTRLMTLKQISGSLSVKARTKTIIASGVFFRSQEDK